MWAPNFEYKLVLKVRKPTHKLHIFLKNFFQRTKIYAFHTRHVINSQHISVVLKSYFFFNQFYQKKNFHPICSRRENICIQLIDFKI